MDKNKMLDSLKMAYLKVQCSLQCALTFHGSIRHGKIDTEYDKWLWEALSNPLTHFGPYFYGSEVVKIDGVDVGFDPSLYFVSGNLWDPGHKCWSEVTCKRKTSFLLDKVMTERIQSASTINGDLVNMESQVGVPASRFNFKELTPSKELLLVLDRIYS